MFANGSSSRHADYSVLPTAIFTDPELGGVGMTEKEAAEQGHEIGSSSILPFVTRAQYIGAKHGLYKIVFDRKTRRGSGARGVARGRATSSAASLRP
jgi:pyruvate/2-oxoglutarate dehydrogenase complex dihydrolipoamide dehydrogenase (E3) component